MMKRQVFLFTVLILAVAAAAQQVSITLDPYTEYVTTPAQTLTGSVDPVDAALTLNDEAVTVAGDGTFSKAVTLLEGRNPFRFEATRDTYDPAQEDITLYLDLDAPTLRITAPKLGFQTNESTVTIYGYADDLLDPNITLTRDSVAIPLTDTAFVEDVTLVTGENTFTYEAEDSAGNVAQTYVNIFYDDTAPTVTITSVDSLNFGQTLDVTVTMDPAADVDSVTVYANQSLIYTGDDGTTVQETVTPDPSALEVLLRARVTDVYGNIAEVEKTVFVLHPYWVHGLVLEDATGHVMAGETVSVAGPTGTVQVVTDLAGGFATLVHGAPVQVSVAATGYVPVTRTLAQPSGHWRVPDMRLTARSDATAVTEGATRGAATISYPSGFSGSARTTFYGGQSLPVLLPVGYSPVLGFELAEASTSGTIQVDISSLAALPSSDPLLVLTGDTGAWRVLGLVTPSGNALQTQIAGAANGAYLIAVRDSELTTAMPVVNDLLVGAGSTVVPAEALADATVFPPSVSILESPSTDFYLRVNGGDTLLSGSLARVDCLEEHDRFDDRVTLPVYGFDVFCYRYGITGASDLLLGKLDVTCREPVQIDLTNSAKIQFSPQAGQAVTGLYEVQNQFDLGNVQLDFTGALAGLTAIRVDHLGTAFVPLVVGAREIAAIDIDCADTLLQSPQLTLTFGDAAAVILLRQLQDDSWVYAGSLTQFGDTWANDPAQSDILESGTYAILALDRDITEIRGTTQSGATAVSGVRVTTATHPYLGLSRSTGAYRFPMFTASPDVEIRAFDPVGHLADSIDLGDLTGLTLLDNQDFSLAPPDFYLVSHQPREEQPFVSLNPNIVLEFSHPVSRTQSEVEANINLKTSGGTSIPINVLVVPDRFTVRILPLQTLAQDADYTLRVETGLTNIYGHNLTQVEEFSFHTLTHAALGELDLTLFYLKQETTGMYLEAPAEAYPDRTVLSIFNRDKAYSLTETLTTADFRRVVEAEVGDVLDLEARTPDGRTAYHQVDVVIQENGDLIMGSGGFSYPINTDLTLKVDRVMANRDVPVRISTATTTEVDTHIADFPPASEMPAMTGLYAIKIEAVEGDDLPQFEGRLETPLDPQTLDDGDLYLIRVSTGIQAPADPLQPSVLTDHTIATIEDAIRIENHEVTNKSNKLSLLRLAFEISNYDLAPFNMIGLYSLNAQNSAAYTKMRIRCLRQKKDQGEPGEPRFIPGDHPDWPEINPSWAVPYETKGQYAAPGIAVYRVRDGVSGLIYEFLGISDAQEAIVTNGWHYSDLPQLRALDPLTGQLVFVQPLDKSIVRDTMGTPIYAVQRFDAVADPNRVDYDPTQEESASISVKWEVVELDDPSHPEVNVDQTELLRTKRKFVNTANRGLRAWVKASFPMSAVNVVSNRTIVDVQKEFENSMDLAEVVLSGIVLAEGRLGLTILATHENKTDIVQRDFEFWSVTDPNDCLQDLEEAPVVLSTIPGNDEEGKDDLDLNIDVPVYIHFSERVTNIDESTVALFDSGTGSAVNVRYFNTSGDQVTAGDELCTLILEPEEALKLDTRYEIRIVGGINGVVDTDPTAKPLQKDGEAIAMYSATFRTRNAPELDLPALTMHSAMTHFRNLVITVKSEEDYAPIEIQVWDARKPDVPATLVQEHEISIEQLVNFRYPSIAVFGPDDLANDTGLPTANELRRDQLPLRRLPDGALVVLGYHRWSLNKYLHILEVGPSGLTDVARIPILGNGVMMDIEKMGPYLLTGFYQSLGESSGPTRVYNIGKLAASYKDLRSRLLSTDPDIRISQVEYEQLLHRLEVFDEYPLPGDPWDVVSFPRSTEKGIEFGFLLGAKAFPGIFRFKPELRNPYIGMPSGGVSTTDDRLIFHAHYPFSSTGMFSLFCGAVPAMTILDSQGLRVRDVAIFSEQRDTGGYLYFYELPEEETDPGNLQTTQPKYTLPIPEGISTIAIDQNLGLLALQTKNPSLFSVLDVKAVFADEGASSAMGLQHPAFVMNPIAGMEFKKMIFTNGHVFGIEFDGTFKQVPVCPQSLRTRGWQIIDLSRWMDNGSIASGADFDVDCAETVVLYAQDQDLGGTQKFTMELSSFGLDVLEEEEAEVWICQGETRIGKTLKRQALPSRRTEIFALVQFVGQDGHYGSNKAQNRKVLRERGFEAFELNWKTTKGGVVTGRGVNPFLVVYRYPDTKYVDPYRSVAGLDGLSVMPQFYEVDHRLTNIDPRLNLSPSRCYHSDFAFQPGTYGIGMMDGQQLHMAVPVWWDVDQIPSAQHNGDVAYPRLLLEQPGQFLVKAKLDASGDAVQPVVVNDLLSQVNRTDNGKGSWELDHRHNMSYVFESEQPLPDFKKIFMKENPSGSTQEHPEERMNYPVFRFGLGGLLPPSFFEVSRLRNQKAAPWENKLKMRKDRVSSNRPAEITEVVADSGGERTAKREYDSQPISSDFVRQIEEPDGVMKITYAYDSDGYLSSVQWEGNDGNIRIRQYTWESVGISKLGGFLPKRLKRIEQGDPLYGGWYQEFQYASNSMKVSSVTTPFGNRAVNVTLDETSGRVTRCGLSGTVAKNKTNAVERAVTFSEQEDLYLSSFYEIGDSGFIHFWETKGTQAKEVMIAADSFMGQIFEHNEFGLLKKRIINNTEEIWEYNNGDAAFKAVPTRYVNPEGQSLSIATSKTQQVITSQDDNPSAETTYFSNSGAVLGSRDLMNQELKATTSTFYVPDGNGFDTNRTTQNRVVPIGGATQYHALELTLNPFMEPSKTVDHGVETTVSSYDDLGRPSDIHFLENKNAIVNYEYEDNVLVVRTIFDSSAMTTWEEYNEEGWLLSRKIDRGDGGVQEISYTYDALGRLEKVEEGGITQQEITYHGDTMTPEVVETPGHRVEYTVADGIVPTISGYQAITSPDTLEEKTEAVILETDKVGRLIRAQAPIEGETTYEYDAWSRPIRKTTIGPNKAPGEYVEYIYDQSASEVKTIDPILDLTTTVRIAQNGLHENIVLEGQGIDETSTVKEYRTTVENGDKTGLKFISEQFRGIRTKQVVSAMGQNLGGAYGKYQYQANSTNNFGQVEGYNGTGGWTTGAGYDALGRLSSITDVQGHQSAVTSRNPRGLIHQGTNFRNMGFSINYMENNNTNNISSISMEGPNSGGGSTVELMSRDDWNSSLSTHWLGASRDRSWDINALDNTTIHKIKKPKYDGLSGQYEAKVTVDNVKGVVSSVEDYETSNITQYDWTDSRHLTINPPSGRNINIEYNAFGQVRTVDEGGNVKYHVKRDDENRIKNVRTEDSNFGYHYDDEDLSSITGGRYDVTFGYPEASNNMGLPEQIKIGDVLTVDYDRAPGKVVPDCVTVTRTGGVPSRAWFNDYGDMVRLQRGFETPTNYTYNSWGAPATMTIGSNTYDLFDDGDLHTWHLPGGVTLYLNPEGQVERMETTGLGSEDIAYDGMGRTQSVELNDQLYQRYTYDVDRLTEIETGPEGGTTETLEINYDTTNDARVASYVRDAVPVGSFIYNDQKPVDPILEHPDRVYTYTDPNGVTATYTYREDGQLQTIDIGDGPKFDFDYDEPGNLTKVQVGDMATTYGTYDKGLPDAMIWYYDSAAVESFTITQKTDGRLEKVESTNYLLELEWENEGSLNDCTASELGPQPRIKTVTKSGPDFGEEWDVQYDTDDKPIKVTITRDDTTVIEEEYGPVQNEIPTRLKRTVDSVVILDSMKILDAAADQRRVGNWQDGSYFSQTFTYDPALGNLVDIGTTAGQESEHTYTFKPSRRIQEMSITKPGQSAHIATYDYDYNGRRSYSSDSPTLDPLVFFYHNSQVLAIGTKNQTTGDITWTHAIGRGTLGPTFVKDLLGTDHDYFIHPDHLGTPYAYHDVHTGVTSYAPYSPYGELLATPTSGYTPYDRGNVATSGFTLPADQLFEIPPFGLAGHIYDEKTGLIYMHHRFLHPRLGHFLTPDFRAPDIYDPSTFTEPYAYAAGNPIMFWDPDGLDKTSQFQILIRSLLEKGRLVDIGEAGETVLEEILTKAGHVLMKGPVATGGKHKADLITFDPKTKDIIFWDNKIQRTKKTISKTDTLVKTAGRLENIDLAFRNLMEIDIPDAQRAEITKELRRVQKNPKKAIWSLANASPDEITNMANRISVRLAEKGVKLAQIVNNNKVVFMSLEESIEGVRGSKKYLKKLGKAVPGVVGMGISASLATPRVKAATLEDEAFVNCMHLIGIDGPIPYAHHNVERELAIIAGEEAGGEGGGWGLGAAAGFYFGGWGAIPGALIGGFLGDSIGGWAAAKAFDRNTRLSDQELMEIVNELLSE